MGYRLDNSKRKDERRKNKKTLVIPERRTGYDRRSSDHNIGHIITSHLSKNEFLLAALLILINILNLGDLIFTYLALGAGHQEGNPFLRYIFVNYDPVIGGYVKITIGTLVTLIIWVFRQYRRMMEATLIILVIFFSIFFYHLLVTLYRI